VALVTISVSMAYGLTAAVSEPESRATLGEMPITVIDRPSSIAPCDPSSARLLQYAIANSWLSAEFDGYCRTERN
jgi:hypothetical protein